MHMYTFVKTYAQDERTVELTRDGKQWNKAEWNEVYALWASPPGRELKMLRKYETGIK